MLLHVCASARAEDSGPLVKLSRLGLPDTFFEDMFERRNFLDDTFERQWTVLRADGDDESRRFQQLWGRRQASRVSEGKFRSVSSGVEHTWMERGGNNRMAWRTNMTLVEDHVQTKHAPLAAFLYHVTAFFGARASANSYMTPPGKAQGFEFHTDGHDTLVLQVEGAKDWEICARSERVEPRVKKEWWFIYQSSFEVDDPAVADCARVTLRPGDILYMPQGQIHRAISSSEDLSLHVTIGLYRQQLSVRQLLLQAAMLSGAAGDETTYNVFADWVDARTIDTLPHLTRVPSSLRCKGADCGFLDRRLFRESMSKMAQSARLQSMPALPGSMLSELTAEMKKAVHDLQGTLRPDDATAKRNAAVLNKLAQVLKPVSCNYLLSERFDELVNEAREGHLLFGANGPAVDGVKPVPWVDEWQPLQRNEVEEFGALAHTLASWEKRMGERATAEIAKESEKGLLNERELRLLKLWWQRLHQEAARLRKQMASDIKSVGHMDKREPNEQVDADGGGRRASTAPPREEL